MDNIVDVTIPVDARAANELRDPRTRDAIGRLVSRVLQRQRREHIDQLFSAIDQLSTDAEAKGLTIRSSRKSWPPTMPSVGTDRL